MILPIRVAGIIIKENNILLIHRVKNTQEYWVLPGGGLEDTDASEAEGLLREIKEETCIDVNISKLIYTHDYGDNKGLYYLCNYIVGEPQLGESIEKERMEKGNNDIYEPVWVPLDELSSILLYPLEIRDWLTEDLKDNFTNTPRTQKLATTDLRQN
ncbi:NUDIX domain-containing protein [Patescibacteria group bacterium]|nr:NUDIX domain-containing protein [Patescibacteria group bacterium]